MREERWLEDWMWTPDIDYALHFIYDSAFHRILVLRPGPPSTQIDKFKTRAFTTGGRIRACRRWMHAHREWEQLQLPQIGDASA